MRNFLRAKIHRARVTAADVEYEGSFGVDSEFLQKVGILPFESVEIYNVDTGARLRTYAIELPYGSRRFESNGAAAHLIRPGDRIIMAAYEWITEQELQKRQIDPNGGPKILLLDADNNEKEFYAGKIEFVSDDGVRQVPA